MSVKDRNETKYNLETDYWFPLFGLVPKLGPLGNWGLDIVKNAISVDNANDYSTNIKGIFAIGDVIPGPMLAHKAEEDGVAAVEIMAGVHGHVDYDKVPGIVYTSPEVATLGKTEEFLKDNNISY